MEAQQYAPSIRTIARAETGTEQEYDEVVDATLLPEYLGGDYAADILTGEDIRTLVYPTAELDILEVSVAPSAPVAGRRLDEIALPSGSLLISTADRPSQELIRCWNLMSAIFSLSKPTWSMQC